MTAVPYVAGVPLGLVFGLKWSTVWSYDAVSGDKLASWTWVTDVRPPWLHAGAEVVIADLGRRRFAGRLNEPEETDGGFACTAYGLRMLLGDYECYEDVDAGAGFDWQPTFVPDDGIDGIASLRAPLVRWGTLGTSPLGIDGDLALSGDVLLMRAAKAAGKRGVVDRWGRVSLVADPTAPSWLLGGMSNYVGTADDEFLTWLWGRYVVSVDGSTGLPNAWATVHKDDPWAAAKFGADSQRTVDLRGLGVLSEADAQGNVDGRFALVGGRMAPTAGFTVTRQWLSRMNGAPGDPSAIRAGDMIRLAAVRDFRTSTANRAAMDLVMGEVEYDVDSDTAAVTPMGYVPRDFSSALAAAQKPEAVEAA